MPASPLPPSSRRFELARRPWTFLAVALFLAARLPFLLDDPAPELVNYFQDVAFSVFDEGWWTMNARHFVLEGRLFGTGFDLFWVSPVQTMFMLPAFTWGGVSLACARFAAIVAALAGILLLARVDGRDARGEERDGAPRRGPTPGEAAALLLAVSFAAAQLGRLATPESVGVFFGLLGATALLRKTTAGALVAGACAVLAALTKPHFAFLAPSFLVSATLLARRDGRPAVRAALAVASGAALPAAFWGAVVAMHSSAAFAVFDFYRNDRWFADAAAGSPAVVAFVKPAAQLLLSGVAYRHLPFVFLPAIFLLAAAALPFVVAAIGRPRCAPHVPDATLVFGVWAIAGVAAVSAIPYQPLRYFLPAIPALAYLAGWLLCETPVHSTAGAHLIERASRLLLGGLVAAQFAFAGFALTLVPALAARSAAARVELLNPEPFRITAFLIEVASSRSFDAMTRLPRELAHVAAVSIAALLACAVGVVLAVPAARALAGVPRLLRFPRARIAAVVVFVAWDAALWARWFPERAQTIPAMAQDLAARLDSSALVSPAGSFSLDNRLRYDTSAIPAGAMFDADGPATHFLVLEEHPLAGELPAGTIERRWPGSGRIAGYELTGGYRYGLYQRGAADSGAADAAPAPEDAAR